MINFGSLITAMVTPFKEDDINRIDYIAAENIITHLVKTGSDSIIISGTTGERPTLTHQEEEDFLDFTLKKVKELNQGTRIIFGAGSNCTKTAIHSAKRAEELGADGILLVVPYYNKPNQEGLIKHFNEISSSTSLPIILYNVPARSVVSLTAESIIELVSNNPNIVALKEASSNFDLISTIRQKFSSNALKIYSGEDTLILPMMSIGADGIISVCSHVVGKQMKDMILAFQSGNNELAKRIHLRIFPVMKAIFSDTNPIGIKAALAGIELCSAELRSPMVSLPKEKQLEYSKLIKEVLEVAEADLV
jgi:4-hydroxy-tetrahydrodipicolinate synthase